MKTKTSLEMTNLYFIHIYIIYLFILIEVLELSLKSSPLRQECVWRTPSLPSKAGVRG